jgi:tetraacyldisaccharide 4'-kinase
MAAGYRSLLRARDWLYRAGVLKSRPLPCAVIAIGNLTVGGTGKTPAVRHAVETLHTLGARPVVVSRGYGRMTRGVHVVADGRAIKLGPEEAGDEPFLLATQLRSVPVVVGENRYDAGRLAVSRFGATAVVLDDGFQHRSLAKDVEIVLARCRNPWGNGRLFPAGPLREPLEALARADVIVASGAGPGDALGGDVADAARRYAPGVRLLTARYEPAECWETRRMTVEPAQALAGRRLLAFAGIAHPPAFRRTLEEVGVTVPELAAFPDHFWYGREDLDRLAARAGALGAEGMVTTEKDWVRLRAVPLPSLPLWVLTVRFRLDGGDGVWRETLGRPLR